MNIFPNNQCWQIEDVRRSHVVYREGVRTAWVLGEALVGGYSAPDYVIYATNTLKWRPPHDQEPISEGRKAEIIERVASDLKGRGLKVQIE